MGSSNYIAGELELVVEFINFRNNIFIEFEISVTKVIKRYDNRVESGVEGQVDCSIEIFNRDSDFIIIVFNIREKVCDLSNLGKFFK